MPRTQGSGKNSVGGTGADQSVCAVGPVRNAATIAVPAQGTGVDISVPEAERKDREKPRVT